MERFRFRKRVIFSFAVVILFTLGLLLNIYQLQIKNYNIYCTRSNSNRVKIVPIAPNRGLIYDRNGVPLALNYVKYQIELIPAKINNLQDTVNALLPIVDLTNEIHKFTGKSSRKFKRFASITLKTVLNEAQVAKLAVNQYKFPGIKIKKYQCRYYPYGALLTPVLGYVSKISSYDFKLLAKQGKLSDYTSISSIGKTGIERYYENTLRGITGYEAVEVNGSGQKVRHLYEQPPQAGHDIYLTVDLKLQQYIWTLLVGSRAAAVVTDPRTGDILAMVSTPSYDPNLFVNGISNRNYNILLKDSNHPLINRVTQGIYPPASTVKPYVTISALSAGVININTSIFDPGWWQLPKSEKVYHDWKRIGHGKLNIVKALEESADTFFYQIAYDMGIDRLDKWLYKFGYGHLSGIDLLEECAGNLPSRSWKMKHFKKPWYQGDTISVGIGQGYWTATPIQMHKALMILINNGIIKVPHLMRNTSFNGQCKKIFTQPSMSSIGNINSEYWDIVKDGMYGVANRPNGTAYDSFSNMFYKVAAKSGTAQIINLKNHDTDNDYYINFRDHKLMTAFAPYEDPKIALTIVLENGGNGLSIGSIARQIFNYSVIK